MILGCTNVGTPPITINDFDNYVQNVILSNYKINEATNYAPILRLIQNKYQGKQADPVFVIFITDGSNADKRETTNIIQSIATEPMFIQFVGIGADDFPFLRKLDELKGRPIDNTGFMHVNDIISIDDSELYSRLLNEFPIWIKTTNELGTH